MLQLAAFNDSLEALRRRGPRGLDVQVQARPEQPPVLQAPANGTDWGSTVGRLVNAAAAGEESENDAPTFSSAAESGRAQQGPGLTQPGTKFLDANRLDIDGALKPRQRQPKQFIRQPVQMFAGGGTLRRPGEVAVVGEEGPEVAVRDGKGATHVIPLSAVEENLRGLSAPDVTPTVRGGGGVLAEAPAQTRPREAVPPSVLDGAPAERPRMVKPRDETPEEARRAGLEGQIEIEREHPEPGSRGLKMTALSAALGALQGFGATGSWQGAAGGAGAGVAANLIDPKILPELQRRQRQGAYEHEIGQTAARQDARLEREGKAADIALKRSQTAKNLRPDAKERKTFTGPDGVEYVMNEDGVSATPVEGVGRKAVAAKVLRTVTRGGKVWYETEDGLKPALDPATGEQLAEELIDYEINGHTYQLTSQKAAEFDAMIETANIGAQAKAGEHQVEAENRNADRQHASALAAWKLEGDRAQEYNALKDEMDELLAKIHAVEKIPEGERKPEQQGQYVAALERFNTMKRQAEVRAGSLNREFVEFGADERARLKPQPAPPAVKPKPAPGRRSGGPAPKQQAPPVSEDEFLATARAQMGGAFDETKARAAYRSRYKVK